MKLRLLSLVSLLIGLLFGAPALQAAIYYVDGNRPNDNQSGTSEANAWKTLGKVASHAFSPGFAAGDEIRFQGGQTFTFAAGATLYIAPGKGGTAASPITFTSYGTGKAVLVAANDKEFAFAYNAAGIRFKNLQIKGNGSATHTTHGISFYNDVANTKYHGVVFDDVDLFGFGKTGVIIGGGATASGFGSITVTNSKFHDNGIDGFNIYSATPFANPNVTITRSQFYNNTGKLGQTTPTGSGLVLGGVDIGLVEHCTAYNNGQNNNYAAGPCGIWTYMSRKVVIQRNESYANKSQNADGAGFDIDGASEDCVIQYNYSHDNDGAGYLYAQYVGAPGAFRNNVLRYNISQNDARSSKAYGGITIWGGDSTNKLGNSQIYNNVVYVGTATPSTTVGLYVFGAGGYQNLVLRNNIFITAGARRLVKIENYGTTAHLKLEGNNHYSSGAAWQASINGTTYGSLAAFRATGQEKVGTTDVGTSVDPLLVSAGTGGTVGDPATLAASLAAYKLQATSPLINAGLTPPTLTGTTGTQAGTAATQDFFAGSVPLNAYDVGVHENAGTPVITAGQTANGTNRLAFSYQIAASNSPTSYALASGSLPTGVTLNTATGLLSGTPTAVGTFTPSFTATNSGGTSAAVVVLLNIAGELASFRTTHGLASDGSQDLLTPAGDGVANLLKYAFNMIGSGTGQATTLAAPNASSLTADGTAGLPLVGTESATGKLQLTYIRRKTSASPGINYTVLFSDTLVSDSWATNPSATESVTSLDATFERVTVTDSAPAPAKRFVRVRVTSTP